ncbi:MAG: delta-lactam-biosynthetic de-N-acetylase [Lachnospiraceae bacterium]
MKRTAKIVLSLLLVFSLLPANAYAAEGNWGLGGYGDSGEKPTGNATAEELSEYGAYYVGSGDDKVIYLTFDAGYENGYTEQILDVLQEEEVPAAFFLVGTYIKENPDIVTRMVEEGHIVGNHTMNHPDMSSYSKEAFTEEMTGTEELYEELIGEEMPKFYRPPQGKYSVSNLEMANELGYTTVFWSLAYVDWYVDDQPTKEQAFEKLIPRVHPGTVLLLHSTSETNANILKELIQEYKGMGYEFRSIDELA